MGLSKAERRAGYRPVPQPNPQQVAVLRRVAKGFLLATHTRDGTAYSYEDGTPMSSLNKRGDNARIVNKMIAEGWLIPIEGESLQWGAPQRYRTRTVEDGLLPRFVRDA